MSNKQPRVLTPKLVQGPTYKYWLLKDEKGYAIAQIYSYADASGAETFASAFEMSDLLEELIEHANGHEWRADGSLVDDLPTLVARTEDILHRILHAGEEVKV